MTAPYKDFDAEIISTKLLHSEICAKRMPIQAELTAIRNRLRVCSSTRFRLPPAEYRDLCLRQTQLVELLRDVESEAFPVKQKLRELTAARDAPSAQRPARHSSVDAGLRACGAITELRNRWSAFAEDQTRVNSMRVMAAKFCAELNQVLADIERISK